jgi:hypothetical protein
MSRNIVVNFGVDEDGCVYVEKESLGSYKWIGYMLEDGEVNVCNIGNEKKDLVEFVGKCVDKLEVDEDMEEEKKKCKRKMLRILNGLIDKELYELGRIRVMIYEWGVEYDGNVGVVLVLEK